MANLRLMSLLSFTLLVVAGCGFAETAPKGLVYCSEGNPETFNPQRSSSSTVLDATSKQLYNRLFRLDETGHVVGDLAKNWYWSPDQTTLTINLHQGVQFHTNFGFTPSRALNATDVLFSFNRIIDPAHPFHLIGGGDYPFFQTSEITQHIRRIEKNGNNQVRFHLDQPSQYFLNALATDYAVILSAEYANWLKQQKQPEKIDSNPIGTGPFVLGQFHHNRLIRYQRHQNYWQGPVRLDQLVYDITPSSSSRVIKLIGGDCDVAALPQVSQLAAIQSYDDLALDTRPGFNVAFWAFNSQKPPLDDVRVRKALSLAVNQNRILAAVYQNTAIASHGLLPPVSWAYNSKLNAPKHNPTLAKQLLRSAGVNNLSISLWVTPVNRIYNPDAIKMAELIQHDLAEIGVKATIIKYDWNTFVKRLKFADYDSVISGWSADNQDPDNFFSPLLSCNAVLSKSNRARWCNQHFDKLIKRAKDNTEPNERKRLYRQLELQLKQQMPLLPLAHASRTLGRTQKWQGNILSITGGVDFSTVYRVP